MLKNYLITALRHLTRNRLQAFINIFGLAVGLSASILIYLYVQSERNFDTHHNAGHRIFRVNSLLELDGQMDNLSRNSMRAGPELQDMFPAIESFCRIMEVGKQTVWYQDKVFTETKVCFADSTYLDFFTYNLIAGDEESALNLPESAVISEETAIKYFGSAANAVGKFLKFTRTSYKVTGVFRPGRHETHLYFDIILSLNSLERTFYESVMTDYFRMMTFTYVKLKEGSSPETLTADFADFSEKNINPWIKQNNVQGSLKFSLQPISAIHLSTDYTYDYPGNSNPAYVYIFSIVGLFILLVACINYMNLTTARASRRAKEVGIRLTAGAGKSDLLLQFFGESLVVTIIAFVLSLVLVELLLPVFNNLTDKHFSHSDIFTFSNLATFLFLIILTGTIAGSYPALYLSRINPAIAVKMGNGTAKMQKGILHRILNPASLRKSLVVLQFTIAVALIICTLVVYKQLHFMKNKHMGFDKENVLVIPVPNDSTVQRNLPVIKTEFGRRSDVTALASASQVPGGQFGKLYFVINEHGSQVNKFLGFMWIDQDFFPLLHIEVKGRNFDKNTETDATEAFIINRACANFLGWEEPIGKELTNGFGMTGKVIGVVEDFNYNSLHNPIEPMVFMFTPNNAHNLLIRLNSADMASTTSDILDKWKMLAPNHPLEYYFLDDHINKNYIKEGKMLTIFGYFTLLTIIISCLGLFGLASYTTEQRTKEIGIRKVLGASVNNISRLITTDFLFLVVPAILLAWPVSWYFMDRWLRNFAFHTDTGWWPFILSGLAAFVMFLLTVNYLARKAASANPIESLRYE